MPISTRLATVQDLASWLQFVPELEQLFGPMPDFESHLRRAVERGTALVAVSGDEVAGAAILSRDDMPTTSTDSRSAALDGARASVPP